MILKSIQLNNIRSYTNEIIEFPLGITLFEGDIGSGKSTILMAIEFSLFGIGNNKGNSLLKTNEDEGFTKLEFSVEGKKYEICRKLKRKNKSISQNSGYIIENEKKTTLSATELKKRIIQILKFNESSESRAHSRIFRYAVYTPQEEMKMILSDSEKRLETIRKAFEMDAYKNAILNSDLIANILDKISVSLETTVQNLQKKEKEYFETQKAIANAHRDQNELSMEIKNLEKRKEFVEENLNQLKNKEKDLIKFYEEQKHIIEKIKKTEKEIKEKNDEIIKYEKKIALNKNNISKLKSIKKPTTMSIKQIDTKIEKYRRDEDLLTNIKIKIEKMNSRLDTLSKILGKNEKNTPKKLEQSIKNLEESIEIEKNQLKNMEKNKNELLKIETQLEVQTEEIEKRLKKISKLDFKCPTCEQIIEEKYVKKIQNENKNQLLKNKKMIEEIISKNKFNEDSILELQSKISKIEELLKKSVSQRPYLVEYLQIKENHNEEIILKKKLERKIQQENKSEFNDPIKYYLELNNKLQNYEKAKEDIKKITEESREFRIKILTLEKNLRNSNKKLEIDTRRQDELNKEILSFKNIQNDIKKYSKYVTEVNDKYLLINKKSASIETRKKFLDDELQKIKIEIENSEIAKKKYDRCNNFHEWLKGFFVPIVDIMEAKIMQYLQYDFNNIYQNWYSILVEDPSKESRIDDDFTPIVEQEGYEMEIHHLSGGEKTSIALAYRLTLNSMLRRETESLKSNLLILDEPTYGFSKSQLSKVKSILTELKSEQIILVSHEKELEGYAQNIFQVTKENGISKISRLS